MSEQAEQLKKRTMRFALDVCKLLKQLPWDEPGPTVKRQLARAATGTTFNYRAACRGRSHDEFTAKIGVVAEEADESQGWLEFIQEAKLIERVGSARSGVHRAIGNLLRLFWDRACQTETQGERTTQEGTTYPLAIQQSPINYPITQLPDYPILLLLA